MSRIKWTPDKIAAKLRAVIAEELGLDDHAVTPDSHIVNDLGANSLDCVELIMRCEEVFKIEIDDDDTERLIYVRDLSKYLAKRLVKP